MDWSRVAARGLSDFTAVILPSWYHIKRKVELTCPSSCTGHLSTGRKKSGTGGAEAAGRAAPRWACLSRRSLRLFSGETSTISAAVFPATWRFHVSLVRSVPLPGASPFILGKFWRMKALIQTLWWRTVLTELRKMWSELSSDSVSAALIALHVTPDQLIAYGAFRCSTEAPSFQFRTNLCNFVLSGTL